jgi:hypothetical protein
MVLSREDVLYRLDILKRSLFLAEDMPPDEALEILERFVSAAEQLGALTAADLTRSRLHDLSADILSLLRQRFVMLKRLTYWA